MRRGWRPHLVLVLVGGAASAWKQRVDLDIDPPPAQHVDLDIDPPTSTSTRPAAAPPPPTRRAPLRARPQAPRRSLRVEPVPLARVQQWTNVGNGALLLLSAPIQWRFAGGLTLAALQGLALSSWLSVCGVLLVLRELRAPFMRRFLRRHVRFATTSSGRATIHLFAATLALSSGSPAGIVVGVTRSRRDRDPNAGSASERGTGCSGVLS
jgi:hypothetical protein